jgi:hypothetical protein
MGVGAWNLLSLSIPFLPLLVISLIVALFPVEVSDTCGKPPSPTLAQVNGVYSIVDLFV